MGFMLRKSAQKIETCLLFMYGLVTQAYLWLNNRNKLPGITLDVAEFVQRFGILKQKKA